VRSNRIIAKQTARVVELAYTAASKATEKSCGFEAHLEHTGGLKMDDKITISKKRYEELLKNEQWLRALEGAGVDNWEGYDIAKDMMDEDVDGDAD
jgi:hypothetical protein